MKDNLCQKDELPQILTIDKPFPVCICAGHNYIRSRHGEWIAGAIIYTGIFVGLQTRPIAPCEALLTEPIHNFFRLVRGYARSTPSIDGTNWGIGPGADVAIKVFSLVLSAGGPRELARLDENLRPES